MTCRACGALALRPRGEKEGISLWSCECWSLNADVSPADLPKYDGACAQASFETTPGVRQSLAETVGSVSGYRRLGRWVDVGFGEGALLVEAARLGWACAGTEISIASLRVGSSRGWDVREAASGWPDESCDVVSLIEVLEHVIDPEGLLRETVRLLRPGGALIATTPNIESLNFRMLGAGWSTEAPLEHVTLFSAVALKQLVGRLPLEIHSLRTTGLNATELMRWRKESISPDERNAGAQRWVQATSSSWGRSAERTLNFLRDGDSLELLPANDPRQMYLSASFDVTSAEIDFRKSTGVARARL